jgi:NAD(P)-dependent dehydrogenase (short-subunit alcohol dehydrogenase family)
MSMLEGKIAIITGAKGGLGTHVTNAFLDAGATVAGVSRSIKGSDFDNPRFVAFPAELSDLQAAASVATATVERFGRIDVLVHLMGGFAGGTRVDSTDKETFDRMIDMNLRSAFFMCKAVIPHMRARKSGRIVAIGSRAAVEGNANAGVYSASKAALIALIRAVALENRDHSISANVVLPGTMDTPQNRAAMAAADPSKWVQPAQVAQMIAVLAADGTAQVNGAVIPIYGSDV